LAADNGNVQAIVFPYFQYIFDITEEEDELMVSMEQKDKRVEKGKDNYTIGFTILKVITSLVFDLFQVI